MIIIANLALNSMIVTDSLQTVYGQIYIYMYACPNLQVVHANV